MRFVLLVLLFLLLAPGVARADEAEDLRYALDRLGADVLSVRCDWQSTAPTIPCRAHYRYVTRYRFSFVRRARKVTTLWCFSIYEVGYNATAIQLPPGVDQIGPTTVMQERFKRCHPPRRQFYRTTSLR